MKLKKVRLMVLVFSLSQDPQNTATATDPDRHGYKQVRAGAHSSTPLHAVPIFDDAVADGVGHGVGRASGKGLVPDVEIQII